MASEAIEHLTALLQSELPRLYAFAYLMCGARIEASGQIRDAVRVLASTPGVVLEATRPAEALLGYLARTIEEGLGRKAEQSFVILDNLLRGEETMPIDANRSPIDGDLSRVPVLLWELKRTCLASVLGCLPPAVRISFILTDLFGYTPAAAAELINIKESAFRVRLTRARRRLEDYLAPRCGHIDRHNPCYCEGRLNVALEANFVGMPPHRDDIPALRYDEGPEQRDIASLYRTLPQILLSEAQRAEILAALAPEPASPGGLAESAEVTL